MQQHTGSSFDGVALARILLRFVVVAAPPLLLAGALLAAPKGATPQPKKPPAAAGAAKPKWTPKPKAVSKADADVDESGGDAPKEMAFKADTKVGAVKADDNPYGPEVKESEHKEGDATVKEFVFGETQIEGRSRWPAVTYFIRRMRAEFEAQKLPHRSFMPEMKATKGDPAVK